MINELKVGYYYISRDGRLCGPIRATYTGVYPFYAKNDDAKSFSDSFTRHGQFLGGKRNRRDLVCVAPPLLMLLVEGYSNAGE